jgi:hypothetical protein
MFKHVNNNSDIENLMDKYKRENEVILKKLAIIDKELGVLHQHEEEIVTKRVFEEKFRDIEKKFEESITNNLNYEKINTVERKLYVLEKRRLGSDFCDYCELEFKAGCERDR